MYKSLDPETRLAAYSLTLSHAGLLSLQRNAVILARKEDTYDWT